MGLVPEKPREVGGDGVEEGLELFLIPGDQGKVFLEALELFLAQAFLEPALEDRAIRGGEGYPALVVDQLSIQLEIGVAQEVGHVPLVSVFPRLSSGNA